MRNVKCLYCEEYRNEWCEKVIDSPYPDILRDCQYFHEAKTRWIPCSERLPEDDTLMLVNYIDRRPDAMDIWIGWHEMENVWYIDGEAHSREFDNEVIAWMPLPEPYKEGQDEQTD